MTEKKKATFPVMGYYAEAFKYLAIQLGFDPVVPPKTTQETIKLGVRHSADMVCFPFKTTLGNVIQGLDSGANVVIGLGLNYNEKNKETCRFGFYSHVQELILRRLGYKFEMLYLTPDIRKTLRDMKKIGIKVSYFKLAKILYGFWKIIQEIEKREYTFVRKEINIGLVGELYMVLEHNVNYNIIHKLREMGVGVHVSIDVSWYIKHMLHIADTKKYLFKEVKKYFPKRIGGHGYESLVNTIWYSKNDFDGVIHLLPLSCMPETMVEMSMDMISADYKIPVYRFPFDENDFSAGFDTRLETFIKLLKRKKRSAV